MWAGAIFHTKNHKRPAIGYFGGAFSQHKVHQFMGCLWWVDTKNNKKALTGSQRLETRLSVCLLRAGLDINLKGNLLKLSNKLKVLFDKLL